ncbi:hypothetical protein GGS23DRAFT_593612 [Durotheca rogersii]|uniref:uncharacterized protein n=1 Tax=Durotheca rogersii TaxID=419775 RepID=UPI0022212182|nr:uncharacterized protein GGS23DRAFT_593612 [Durotheca rogersii]KAI5866880.1 hypothetical protein GGS23DRAFT_593612 [Durotheca rogersii]
MAAGTAPEASLSHLPNADGSATFAYAGYTVVGAVNGPIEVQRRDELPEEAVVDVISTLRQIILVNNFPRTLIQVILQVTTAPENEYVNTKVVQASSNLPILPALLQTAVLSLLSAAVPLTATLTSTSLAILADGGSRNIVVDPSPREIETSQSFHVFSFTSHDELVLAQSEGIFTMKEWDDGYTLAHRQCCPTGNVDDGDTLMDDDGPAGADLKHFTRSVLEEKIASDLYWK